MATKQILLNVLYSDILTILVNSMCKKSYSWHDYGPILIPFFFFTVHLIFLCSMLLYSDMPIHGTLYLPLKCGGC